jgi:hypothetical protein
LLFHFEQNTRGVILPVVRPTLDAFHDFLEDLAHHARHYTTSAISGENPPVVIRRVTSMVAAVGGDKPRPAATCHGWRLV